MPTGELYDLAPAAVFAGDWFQGIVPANIEVGVGTKIDSSASFKAYRATGPIGLRTGRQVTFWGAAFAIEGLGCLEVGDQSFVLGALFTCTHSITIGRRVFIASGVTITDSDFHPLSPGDRLFDAIAISPVGDRMKRPSFGTAPVVIEDDVWIGFNATILKGVRIGAGAVIAPGAVVTRHVPEATHVAGNPARPVEDTAA